jgi:hypothetical protein
VKEPLCLRSIGIGSEDHFPRERLRPGQRMFRHDDRVAIAAELHRLAVLRVDNGWMAENLSRVSADRVRAIEPPDLLLL